jgi:hemoglobin
MTSDPCQSPAVPGMAEGEEEQIAELVRLFYSYVHDDPLLAPIFDRHVAEWERHLTAMRDFWSMALLGSDRYKGNAYAAHMRLPLTEAHFERWLALWQRAADQSLPPELARRAIQRGRHMAHSFSTGLLPWKHADGSQRRDPS